MDQKRKDESNQIQLAKKPKTNEGALISSISSSQITRHRIPQRSSSLAAPIILLTGHTGSILSSCFSKNGEHIASSDATGKILLWNTYDNKNFAMIDQKTTPITQIKWSADNSLIFAASHDKFVSVYDAKTTQRTQKLKGHTSVLNGCAVSPRIEQLLASVSDDGTCLVWDRRTSRPTISIEEKYPLLAVDWSKDSLSLYTAGIENTIHCWDTRNITFPLYSLNAHQDTITGISVSHDGNSLCSTGMDNVVNVWDIKPFPLTKSRHLATLNGAPHGYEKNLIRPAWSPDSRFITCGSADRSVVVWNVSTQRILYKLPGHKGCVNEVDWHPKEPIILSGSQDKTMFMGELQPSVLQ